MLFADAIKAWASSLDPTPDAATMRMVRKVWAAARKSDGGQRPVAQFTQTDLDKIVAAFDRPHQAWVEQTLLSVGQWAAHQPAGPGDPGGAKPSRHGTGLLLGLVSLAALIIIGVVGYRILTGG